MRCSVRKAGDLGLRSFVEAAGETGPNGQKSHRPVHGPGIEIGNPEPAREHAGDRRFAGAGGTIDGNDQGAWLVRGLRSTTCGKAFFRDETEASLYVSSAESPAPGSKIGEPL